MPKKEMEFISTLITVQNIGSILSRCREKNGLSQQDIADNLGYNNRNFISMVEKGTSKPPMAKLYDICKAYRIDIEFLPMMVIGSYPDAWKTFVYLLKDCKQFRCDRPNTNIKDYEKRFSKYANDLNVHLD